MTTLDQMSEEVVRLALKLKATRCEEEGGPEDVMPQLDVRGNNGKVGVAIVDDGDLIPFAIVQVAEQIDPSGLRFVAFISDSYVKKFSERPDYLRENQLRDEFDEGNMEVSEAIVVCVLDVHADVTKTVVTSYTYNEVGQPKFSDTPINGDDEYGGGIIRLMREGVANL